MALLKIEKEPSGRDAQPCGEAASQPVIEVRNVTVAYRTYRERPTSLKETIIKIIRTGKIKHYSTFDALADVSLNIASGTVLGIIGSNGSGKSTLLKVLSQVLKPTQGYARTRGSVSALIELGAGFDPELNAVENIFLNGSLHGLTKKQLLSRVGPILEFAELKEFAETPIKYYSSGMYARLGFSVAVDIDPDILLVDEILAVGDERFQSKCRKVFQDFMARGKTIVIVSHDVDMLKNLGSQIAVLSKGRLLYLGEPKEAISVYRSQNYKTAL
jgi:ABC-type polysaccharide/polyol phosphate transport system ATPase subunit